MTKTTEKKLYICSVRAENMVKRIYLEGDASQHAEEQFSQLQQHIPEIGETSSGWDDFYTKVIKHFQSHGFTQVPG